MQRKKPGVDAIKDVLEAALAAFPESVFINSLFRQYEERGGLSKKQLQGLFGKALKIKELSPAKLATLEAEILRKPTRYKSSPPPPKPMYTKNEDLEKRMDAILAKYPQHKRVLFLRSKYTNHEPLSQVEISELEKFFHLLIGKP